MFLQTFFSSIALAQTVTTITPDGNTDTWVGTSGSVTDVRTGTVIGRTGLNSFLVFDVGADSTVNLHVPSGARHLINLVHDRRSIIDGTLNSVMDGAIGGDVYFLNPYGIIVGEQGTLNVGSLTLITPEPEFMRGFFARRGEPNTEGVSQVLEGLVPISRTGLISVRGQVNAVEEVDIAGGSVEIGAGGVVATGASFVASRPDFSDVLNMGGLAGATRASVEPGGIRIVAVEDVTHAGVISADGGVLGEGGESVDGGDVLVRAGRDIVLQAGSLISARGWGTDSDGGEIVVFADREAVFSRGAVIDARGGDVSGDGGFIELSALDTVRLEGGAFRAWATDGRAGKVLIDPADLIVSSDQFLNGADYNLEASRRITIEDGVTISTRRVQGGDHESASSTGDSGNITSGNRHTQTKFIVDRLGMSPGDLVALNEMDTRLLAFNDTYDVQLHAELRPGKSFGTTDVVVYVFEPDNNEYSLWVDSGGREEFGLERYGFTWTNRSLFGRRDALTLSLTAGKAAWSGMLTYSVPVSRGGARVTTTYSYNHVDVVGGAFHDVDIAGDSSLTDVSVNVPFRNRRGDRFDVVGGYQQLESGTYFEGHRLTGYTLQTWRVGTSGQLVRQDGANRWAYSYNFVSGRDSVVNESFSKHTLTGSFQRLFRNGTVLTLTVSGQLTDADLLPESEQYKLGGISTVRGFLSGQLAGDEGYLVNVEWTGAWMPWLRWTLYLDHGAAFPYKGNLEPIGPEDYVTAAAVGLHVQMTDYLHGQILWGKPLDREDDGVVYLRVQADF